MLHLGGIPPVTGLFFNSSPTAIRWFVISIYIYPIQCMTYRPRAHIIYKCIERLLPTITYYYATISIQMCLLLPFRQRLLIESQELYSGVGLPFIFRLHPCVGLNLLTIPLLHPQEVTSPRISSLLRGEHFFPQSQLHDQCICFHLSRPDISMATNLPNRRPPRSLYLNLPLGNYLFTLQRGMDNPQNIHHRHHGVGVQHRISQRFDAVLLELHLLIAAAFLQIGLSHIAVPECSFHF